MSTKKKFLLSSAALIVAGVLTVVIVNITSTEPSFTCAEDGKPTAGFTDNSQNNCAITIESYNAWLEWRKERQVYRNIGLGIAAVGLVVGVIGLVKKSKKTTAQ